MKGADLNRISAIVLAAGQSKRMGQNKLLMPFRGKPLLTRVLDLVESLGFGEKILVTSRETVGTVKVPPGFITVLNESPESGQALSLKLGVTAAALDYYMFFLADMPLLEESDALKIIAGIDGGRIIVPKAGEIPANPVIFPKKFRRELLEVSGDKGGRSVISAHEAECKAIFIENAEAFRDIDTPEEYSSISES